MSDFEKPVELTVEVFEEPVAYETQGIIPDTTIDPPRIPGFCLNPDKYLYKHICKRAEHYQSMMGIEHDMAMIMAAAEIKREDLVEDNILNLKIENDMLAEAVKECKVFVPYDTRGELISVKIDDENIVLDAEVEQLGEK
jgi:hypothetical protein